MAVTNDFSWSKSRDEMFRACLRRYYFHYYGAWGGWNPAGNPRARQLYILKNLQPRAMWAGDRVHRAIHAALTEIRAGGPPPDAAVAVEGLLAEMRKDFRDSLARRYLQNPRKACGLFEHEYELDIADEQWKEIADHAVHCLQTFFASEISAQICALPADAWLEMEELASFTLDGIKVYVQLDFAQRTANGVTLNLTYNGWNLIEESDATGALQQVYVHGARVDELLTKISGTSAVYFHADGLGSTVALTDETGSVVESFTYDAFGAATIRNASGVAIQTSGYQNRFMFTGREWLSDAGIYDYRSRVYSPTLGRFLQTDPIRFSAGDVNIYRYCGNNPTNLTDPLGENGKDDKKKNDITWKVDVTGDGKIKGNIGWDYNNGNISIGVGLNGGNQGGKWGGGGETHGKISF